MAPRQPRSPAGNGADDERALRIAAIDVGSNSIRQVVADVSPRGTISVVDELKATPRLGAGVHATGALAPDAMRRALDALGRMATLAAQLRADRIAAVATSAVREAANGAEFLARVRAETGLELRLLDGEEEARLAFRSALAHFELTDGPAVVMDIGGGSLELALSAGGVLDQLLSFPLGAIALTERYLAGGTRRRDVERLRKAVRRALKAELPREWHGAMLIGSGGTFTALAAMYLERRGMTAARTVHATAVPREKLELLLEYLQELPPAERAQVPGLSPARAEIIVAGLAVAAEVAARIEAREVLVSAYGIREGLLLESAQVPPTAAYSGRTRERSVRAFAERCRFEAPHAKQVRLLALQLFDQLGPRLGCSPADRTTLADAALLHDVGYHVNYAKHHKHSYHLIVHADLLGVSPEEQVVIANVARYHRGAPPKKRHEGYAVLDGDGRARVRRLSALLRVADGLDRGHVSAVERVHVRRADDGALEISVTPNAGAGDCRLELWGAARKADLLAEVSGSPVRVVDASGAAVTADEEERADATI
jgi:exopolyphosphatase / guanosine-5'-triphosphate,3'-diphosphate pyrophosphatase